MKTAIVHDVFTEFGGAERVLLGLIDLYPDADIFIPVLKPAQRIVLQQKTKGKIITSYLNHIPGINIASVFLKPLFYLYWEQLDFAGYDLVISSSHTFSSKSVITGPNTLHVSYVHTPPRYLYTEMHESRALHMPFTRILLSPLLQWLRLHDFIGAQRPDILVANSETVAARIRKYYRRDSVVIYPPVRAPRRVARQNPKYYLCFSRLSQQKRIDLAIRACNQSRDRLVIVGTGSQEAYLRSIAGPTIEFLGVIPDGGMAEVWAGAKALLYPSVEEDFGIVPIEAMSHGIPVIAYRSGAVTETLREGETGLFFDILTPESLMETMVRFRNVRFSGRRIALHAGTYNAPRFESGIRRVVQNAFMKTGRMR